MNTNRIHLFAALGGCMLLHACSDPDVESHDDTAASTTSGPDTTGSPTGSPSTTNPGDDTTPSDDTLGESDTGSTSLDETTTGDDTTGVGTEDDTTGGEVPLDPPPEGGCHTVVPSALGGAQVVELCEVPSGVVRHVRITGLDPGAQFSSAQLFLGFEEAPAGPQAPLDDGQFKLMLYAGTPTTVYPTFGSVQLPKEGAHDFTAAPSTICFDILDGSEVAPPSFILWVDGVDGAICSDFETLTRHNAYAWEVDWNGSLGAIAKGAGNWFYQAHGIDATPVVTLVNRGAAHCETIWTPDTDWQPLCEPITGARHFRVEQLEATANSSYAYLVVGEEDDPQGNPASEADDGKVIVTGGRNHMGLSWTWFRFAGESTTQFQFANTDGPLYASNPTTICADIADDAQGNAHTRFWASGASGADCTDAQTLSSDNALHEETWTAPLATGQSNFIKTNNANISLTRVVVYNATHE